MIATIENKSLFENNFEIIKTEDYLVDINYGQKDWTMVSALREILANMLDTKSEYDFYYENGVGTISDKGCGLPRQAFVIGASTKTNDNTSIGTYGEGLKMSMITSIRCNRRISISTKGYGAEVTSVFSDEYNTNLMRVIFNDNSYEEGTCIKIECTKEEWEDAIDLFLQFKEGYQKVDNNLFLPSGYVCILGLKTEEKSNLLFSYDLNDKTITNRDRNTVKSRKLKTNMEKILNGLKNQKAIRMYFDGLEESPESEEFKIALDPKNKTVWNTVVTKMYGDKVAYSTNIDSDIKAASKGFKVIKCPTKYVQKSMSNIGLKSSKEVSRGVKSNVGILENDKITYPISKNYVENWSFVDAGREILANAIDGSRNGEKAKIYYEDGYCIISDNGVGIDKKNFVIGNSQKQDSDIGFFGEGLKLAGLLMAREDRNMSIETKGFTYYPMLEENEEFNTEIFSIKFIENRKTEGTTIKFKATEEEVESIKALFLEFKENMDILTYDDIEIILNEKNNIYVKGLKSASINTMFSYNVFDKNIVNTRDRNHINEDKFNDILSNFYNTTTDKKIMSEFLLNWKEDRYLHEYKLIITPIYNNLELWKEVVEANYDKACLSCSEEDNWIAKSAGYEILSNVPPYVKELLSLYVPQASTVAEEYREKGILLDNRIIFPIISDYCSGWDKSTAIKELISNALDTETDVDVNYEKSYITIEDKGIGLNKRNLLIGSTTSSDIGKAIGNFGEGLKMSALVLSRLNCKLEIETVGFTIKASMMKATNFDADVLVFDLEENERTIGTKITFKGTKKELDAAKEKFLVFNDSYTRVKDKEDIYTPGGMLFVNGVQIMKVNSVYSYDLKGIAGKRLLNRDRNSLNIDDAKHLISYLIAETKDEEVIEDILLLKDISKLESLMGTYYYQIRGYNKKRWQRVMKRVYENCCLPLNNSESNLVAKDRGINVLINIPQFTHIILRHLGMSYADKAVKDGDKDYINDKIVNENDLNDFEKARWELVKTVVTKEHGDNIVRKIGVSNELSDPYEGTCLGMYVPLLDKCLVLRDLLSEKYPLSKVLGVMFHEITHMNTGHHDRTRDFENSLTDTIGELLEKLYC